MLRSCWDFGERGVLLTAISGEGERYDVVNRAVSKDSNKRLLPGDSPSEVQGTAERCCPQAVDTHWTPQLQNYRHCQEETVSLM